jgi:NADH-quinone oxidoreductase subunit E
MTLTKVDAIIDRYQNEDSWLVMILQDIQQEFNFLPKPALERVAEKLHIPLSRVYNVATFYSSFSLEERGKYLIKVCDGTACHLRGFTNLRDEITRQLGITPGKTTKDKMFTLEVVACLGACALAPVMTVNSAYYGQMTPKKIRETLEVYKKKT